MGCCKSKHSTETNVKNNNNDNKVKQPQENTSLAQSSNHNYYINNNNNHRHNKNNSRNSNTYTSRNSNSYNGSTINVSQEPVFVGLDFGTIYSSISILKNDRPILVDLQGKDRILSLIESPSSSSLSLSPSSSSSRQFGSVGTIAMELVGLRSKRVIFTPKLRLEAQNEKIVSDTINEFFSFIKEQAKFQDSMINSVVMCLPACYSRKNEIKIVLEKQFPVSVIILSDLAAIYLCHLHEKYNTINETTKDSSFIISFGGGYISAGLVSISKSQITVQKDCMSQPKGGDHLVEELGRILVAKAGINDVRSPTRLWHMCMKKMEVIHSAEAVEFDGLEVLGFEEDLIEVRYSEIQPFVDKFLMEIEKVLFPVLNKAPATTKILLSGGMCNFTPFRKRLEASFPNRVQEMFSLKNSCVKGTAYRATLNPSISLKDSF